MSDRNKEKFTFALTPGREIHLRSADPLRRRGKYQCRDADGEGGPEVQEHDNPWRMGGTLPRRREVVGVNYHHRGVEGEDKQPEETTEEEGGQE